MLFRGIAAPRAQLVISASSPPCLLVVALVVAQFHRARCFHWIMDVYPEIAVALKELPEGALVRGIGRLMGWSYRRCEQVVVLDEDMAQCVGAHGISAKVIPPWVFIPVLSALDTARSAGTAPGPEAPGDSSPPWTWIYSGNLGRAHEWETLLQTQALLEARGENFRLRFQGGGPSWPAAQARARELGLKQCEWLPYVAEEQLPASLLRAQCCVVSQLPDTRGMLWPSKLGLLMSLPRPLLWVGPVDGSVAKTLSALPHAGVFAPGQEGEIADWLVERVPRGDFILEGQTLDPLRRRADCLAHWVALVN
jgi:hypothetical protein